MKCEETPWDPGKLGVAGDVRGISVVLVAVLLLIPSTVGDSRGNLPALQILSPLAAGLYNEEGSIAIVVQVTGVDPVSHGTHEVVVRVNLEHKGWRDMDTWLLREAKAWASPSAGAGPEPLEFRSNFVDVPSGRHVLEITLRAPPSDIQKRFFSKDGAPPPPPSFDASTHTPFIVRAIPALEPRPGWNATTCTLLVDSTKIGGIFKQHPLVGFVEGAGQDPVKFEDLATRHCFIYRVLDVSSPAPEQDTRQKLLQGVALLTGIGPIDGDSSDIFSRYSEEVDIPILVNRLCFARREKMDLLFLAGTMSMQSGQTALALKAKGVMAALREYSTVVWADMGGVMPLAPRPASRNCIPFTTCWPPTVQVLLPRAPLYPHNPSSALMIFRRSSQAFAFLSASMNSPVRTSSSELVVLADTVLSVLRDHGSLTYYGQCSRPGATLACWAAVVAPSPKHSWASEKTNLAESVKKSEKLLQDFSEPVGGMLLGKPWCDVEPAANLSLVCPCNADAPPIAGGESGGGLAAVGGWCGEPVHPHALEAPSAKDQDGHGHGKKKASRQSKGGENKSKSPCNVWRCNEVEVLFVTFGPGSHFAARGPEVSRSLPQRSAYLSMCQSACVCAYEYVSTTDAQSPSPQTNLATWTDGRSMQIHYNSAWSCEHHEPLLFSTPPPNSLPRPPPVAPQAHTHTTRGPPPPPSRGSLPETCTTTSANGDEDERQGCFNTLQHQQAAVQGSISQEQAGGGMEVEVAER